MRTIRVDYPHYPRSGAPQPMKAVDVWQVAAEVRRQAFGPVGPRRIEMAELVGRVGRLAVNGVDLSPVWDLEHAVHDDDGRPVMGVCEYEDQSPDCAMLSVNRDVVDGYPHLERSTALHELGHAIFDAPAWARRGRQLNLLGDQGHRVYRMVTPNQDHLRNRRTPRRAMDWREFRANEFMGAFLTPPDLLHRALIRQANAAGWPTIWRPHRGKEGYPAVDIRDAAPDELQAVIESMAEEFGLSPEFIWVRLQKYRLLIGRA